VAMRELKKNCEQ